MGFDKVFVTNANTTASDINHAINTKGIQQPERERGREAEDDNRDGRGSKARLQTINLLKEKPCSTHLFGRAKR